MSKYWLIALFIIAVLLLTAGCPKPKTGTPLSARPGTAAADANKSQGNPAETPNTPETTPPATGTTPEGTPATDGTTPPASGTETTPPAATPPATTANPEGANMAADANVVQVIFETTAGNITLAVHKDWAPIGAAHFLELVKAGYYDGAPFFRVVQGFMAQCGFSGNYELTKKWMEQTIQDEQVKQGNEAMMVAFGKTQLPNSRSTHIFINTFDNRAKLDSQGFACFAQVVEGMDVVAKFYVTGENPQTLQGILAQPDGIAQFKKMYPDATFITKAYIKP